MKNRPLCSLCLVIAILIGVLTAGAGAKFVPELRPSPVEQYGEKDDGLIVRGQVYKKEEKEKVHFSKKCVDIWCAQWYYKQADSFEAAQKINIRVWRSLVSRLNGVQEASSSNLDTRTILTKRYRCVWRKARRINRFRS